MTAFGDWADDLPDEMLADFLVWYDNPDFVSDGTTHVSCSRCGAMVDDPETHVEWHRQLSLVMWLVKGWINSHSEVHETVSEELMAVLDQLKEDLGDQDVQD